MPSQHMRSHVQSRSCRSSHRARGIAANCRFELPICTRQADSPQINFLSVEHWQAYPVMRTSGSVLAQIGRLASPKAESLGVTTEDKAKDFFREVCRWVPWTIKNYKLDELTGPHALRSNLSFLFRQHNNVKDPKAVDILIYKGREELEAVALQHKQRHHLIQSFLVEPEMRRAELYREGNMTISKFLENFYEKKNTGY